MSGISVRKKWRKKLKGNFNTLLFLIYHKLVTFSVLITILKPAIDAAYFFNAITAGYRRVENVA